jgi:hypothetical protein
MLLFVCRVSTPESQTRFITFFIAAGRFSLRVFVLRLEEKTTAKKKKKKKRGSGEIIHL